MTLRRRLLGLCLFSSLPVFASPSIPPVRVAKAPIRIELQTPTSFYRHGVKVSSTQAVLLQVEVRARGEFAPRGITPPLILYGSGVCDILRGPLFQPHADVLCPPWHPGDEATVWLTRSGTGAILLDEDATAAQLREAVQAQRSATVSTPAGPPVSYSDRHAVAKALPKPKPSDE